MIETTLQIMSRRRSCRVFQEEQLSHEEIDALVQAGQGAPIGMNKINEIQIIVVQNKELLQEIETSAIHFLQQIHKIPSAIYNAPTLIMVAIKKYERAFQKSQYLSAACILENMILTATEMGVGSVYLSGVTTAINEDRALLDKLGIPEDYETASAISIGKPAQELPARDLTEKRIATKWLV